MQTYSEERVAEALAALVRNGNNLKGTARELGVPVPTLRYWRDQASTPSTRLAPFRKEEREVRWDRIGGLFVEYLEANLRTGIVISRFATDPASIPDANHTWLEKQTAEGLGTLYGIMSDKARLLGQSMEHAALERQRLQLEAGVITTDSQE